MSDDCRLDWTLTPCCDLTSVDADVIARATATAIKFVDRITGYKFGVCPSTIAWPCAEKCPKFCNRCPTCRGERVDLFPLMGRVVQIIAVTIGGVEVDADQYQLTSNRYLVPFTTGPLYPIPPQHPNDPPDSEFTWSVEADVGLELDADVLFAASDLMCQLVNYCIDKPCDIPANAISVTREGITIRLDTGLDAIPSVKMLRQAYTVPNRKPTGIFDPARFPRGKVPT